MASFFKFFGSSIGSENKQKTNVQRSETSETIEHWEKEINDTIPNPPRVINRGITESAFEGNPRNQRILGIAFLLFSKELAQKWLSKAAEGRDLYSKVILGELAKENSDKYLMIWWSTKDFTQQIGYPPINVLDGARDITLNKVLYKNAIIVPFLDDVIKNESSYEYIKYIRDNIDADIIPNTEVICVPLEDVGCSEQCTPIYKLTWQSSSRESFLTDVIITKSFDQDSKYEKEHCLVRSNKLFPELSPADYFNLIQSDIDPNIIPGTEIKMKKYKYYGA